MMVRRSDSGSVRDVENREERGSGGNVNGVDRRVLSVDDDEDDDDDDGDGDDAAVGTAGSGSAWS